MIATTQKPAAVRTPTSSARMFANFPMGILVPLVGSAAKPEVLHQRMREAGARIGLESIKQLLDGTVDTVRDFEVVKISGIHGQLVAHEEEVNTPVNTGAQPATLKSSPQQARGRGRDYPPTGEIKPLKRGTVYAKLMEMLLAGATMPELLAATENATAGGVNDVLSWQIKHRGYGLRFEKDTGKYFIVLPKGHKGLTYAED